MESMVRTAQAIESEIEEARGIWDVSASGKRKESQSSSSSGKKQRTSNSCGFQSHGYLSQGHGRVASQVGQMVCFHCQ